MKSKLSLPAILITFWISYCVKRKLIHCLNLNLKDGLQYLHGFNGLRCIFRGATLERAKSTTKQLREYSKFDGAIETHTRKMPTISSVESPEPNIVTLDDDSNDPTSPNGFGAQQPIALLSLSDLNLLPNPFIILAGRMVVPQNSTRHDENDSPQSPEPSDPSFISTPPMNVSTIVGWETPHTTVDDNTFYSKTSQDEYTRPLPWMKLSIRKAHSDENICCSVHPRRHHLAR